MSKFNFQHNHQGNFETYLVSGFIDEEFIQSDLVVPTTGLVRFDLNKLEGINSCGIREFINFLKRIPGSTQVEYHGCPSAFVQQLNMVNGFLGSNRKVVSVYAPYVDEDTDEEHIEFIDLTSKDVSSVPRFISADGKNYSFDGSIEKYFRFLSFK